MKVFSLHIRQWMIDIILLLLPAIHSHAQLQPSIATRRSSFPLCCVKMLRWFADSTQVQVGLYVIVAELYEDGITEAVAGSITVVR